MKHTMLLILSLLVGQIISYAQPITVGNAHAIAITETDSMQVKLQLDSMQLLVVRDIQVRYYDSITIVSSQLTADERKTRMQQLQEWRTTALQSVLSSVQWYNHQQYMEAKRLLIEQRIREHREQRANKAH